MDQSVGWWGGWSGSMKREWNDFCIAWNQARSAGIINDAAGGGYVPPPLTFGRTYGKVFGLYLRPYWFVSFFVPLSICTILLVIPTSRYLFYFEEYHRYSDIIIAILVLYGLFIGNASMIYGVAAMCVGRRKPPPWRVCLLKTSHTLIPLLLIAIFFGIQLVVVLEMVHFMSAGLDVIVQEMLQLFGLAGRGGLNDDDSVSSSSSSSSGSIFDTIQWMIAMIVTIGSDVLLEVVLMGVILYYATLYLIIVVPVVIFEHKYYNPISAMLRSYQLTKQHRMVMFGMIFTYTVTWYCTEYLLDYIRYEVFGTPMITSSNRTSNTFWNSNNDGVEQKQLQYNATVHLAKHLFSYIDMMVWWCPTVLFLPILSILQTVIYISVSRVQEIRADMGLPG